MLPLSLLKMKCLAVLLLIGASLAQECPVCPEPIQCAEGEMVCSSMPEPGSTCPDPATGCLPPACPVETCIPATSKNCRIIQEQLLSCN